MTDKPEPRQLEKTLAIFFLGLVVFVSPLTAWWSQFNLPWFAPYFLWLLIIILSVLIHRLSTRHDI